jgi:chromosome segregation ATPase
MTTPGSNPATPPRPALGSSVSADLDALKNDVEQARELAGAYQRQLAQQSNEHATLKLVFEKTRDDLVRLHNGITQLREERHEFANQAMRAMALEMKLERMTKERDCLQNEVIALRNARAAEADPRVAQLTQELEALRAELRGSAVAREEHTTTADQFLAQEGHEIGDDSAVTIVPTEPVNGGRKLRRY